MSVRKIPKNYRNLTGVAASVKSKGAFFESTLERDCLTLLDFDSNVIAYDVQPVAIDWVDDNGKKRVYTPDVLVKYRHKGCSFSNKDNVLYEIKYRSDIEKNWDELKPKFKAAFNYARKMGWRFKILTEVEIRTVFMENARFLLPYVNNGGDDSHIELLVHNLLNMRQCSVESLLKAIFNDKWARAELIPTLWYLLGINHIKTDLNLPLNMSSEIWIGD